MDRTGTSVQLSLMWGDKQKWLSCHFNDITLNEPTLQTSSSPIPNDRMTEWQNVWIQITAFLCHDIALISINLISSTLKQTKVIKCCTYLKQNQRRNFVPKIFVWLCLSVCQSLNYSAFQLASSDVTGCGHIIHVCSCDPRSVWRLFSVIVIQSCNFSIG